MLRQLTDLNYKRREFIKMMSLLTVLHPPAEAHSGTSQGSELDLFVRLVNGFKLTLLFIFCKSFVVDAGRGPEYLTCSSASN